MFQKCWTEGTKAGEIFFRQMKHLTKFGKTQTQRDSTEKERKYS